MKFYIASRVNRKEDVKEYYKKLKSKNHTVSFDWTNYGSLKPYSKNKKIMDKLADAATEGIRKCDVFVLLTDESGTGMYTELGIAINNYLNFGKPEIYIIGDYLDRSPFYFHYVVNSCKTFDEVLEKINP
jgi:hypothetical protein